MYVTCLSGSSTIYLACYPEVKLQNKVLVDLIIFDQVMSKQSASHYKKVTSI